MPADDHRQQAQTEGSIPIALVTVSDTRTPETDKNGPYLRQQIEAAGHTVTAYRIIPDEAAQVKATLEELVSGPARVILFNGGTGIAQRDRTYDVISHHLEKTLPGFGEIFRMLSFEEIGAAAMLSRAVAGVYAGTFIVCMPGSHNAVKLAWEKLLHTEIQHIAWELLR